MTRIAVITIDLDPYIHLGPLDIAWHGLMTAIGILIAGLIAMRYARARGLDADPLFSAIFWAVVAGVLGARALFLLENDAEALLAPAEWIGSQGFSVYGGMIAGGTAAALFFRQRHLGLGYLDALAAGFPFGMAVGRIGDLINGEHYGGPSDLPWAIRYAHPAAEVPSGQIAYHPGGIYEIVLALGIAVVVGLVYRSLRRPGQLLFLVIGLYAIGRFAMFFYRVDSEPLMLGLDTSQWISLAIAALSAVGFWRVSSRPEDPRGEETSPLVARRAEVG